MVEPPSPKKTCIIVIACNSNPPKKKKVNDHFVYQLSYGHAIWPTASVLCKTFRYSKPSKNVLANVGFTLAAISLPFWDGLSNIPCQCSGKSNMYPKHVHDTLGDKWRVHNNYLVDYILIHAPKGHHRKSGRSYRIRFSWDVHFLRKNSCALLANPKAVFRRAGSRFTLVRLPPTQASNTPTKQWIVCCKQEWYETAFLQVQSFQKASWNNPWSLSGSSCGSRLEITKNSWNLKPETRIEITAPVKY